MAMGAIDPSDLPHDLRFFLGFSNRRNIKNNNFPGPKVGFQACQNLGTFGFPGLPYIQVGHSSNLRPCGEVAIIYPDS